MTIETDQLVLRPWEDGDAAELFALARDPEIGPAAGWAPHTSERESLEVIRHVLRVPECYAVIDRRTGELLGAAALKGPGTSRLAASRHEFELGYWIGRPFWGYGYATEAAEALVRRAITELGATLIWGATRRPSVSVVTCFGPRPSTWSCSFATRRRRCSGPAVARGVRRRSRPRTAGTSRETSRGCCAAGSRGGSAERGRRDEAAGSHTAAPRHARRSRPCAKRPVSGRRMPLTSTPSCASSQSFLSSPPA